MILGRFFQIDFCLFHSVTSYAVIDALVWYIHCATFFSGNCIVFITFLLGNANREDHFSVVHTVYIIASCTPILTDSFDAVLARHYWQRCEVAIVFGRSAGTLIVIHSKKGIRAKFNLRQQH